MTRTNTDRIDDLAKTAVETASRVDNLDQRVEKETNSIWENLAEQKASASAAAVRANERLQHLEMQLGILSERDAARERDINRFRDEDAALRKENADLRRELAEARQETAVLKQQLQDHVAQYQEWDKRRWGLIVLLLGAVLSLASGLIVTLAKK